MPNYVGSRGKEMRAVKTHPEKSIRFTESAAVWCEKINLYKKDFPTHTFRQIAEFFDLSESNARRYYYGVHHVNLNGCGYSQVRKGACVSL